MSWLVREPLVPANLTTPITPYFALLLLSCDHFSVMSCSRRGGMSLFFGFYLFAPSCLHWLPLARPLALGGFLITHRLTSLTSVCCWFATILFSTIHAVGLWDNVVYTTGDRPTVVAKVGSAGFVRWQDCNILPRLLLKHHITLWHTLKPSPCLPVTDEFRLPAD